MTATVTSKPWDFSQVLELVNSLQPKDVGHFRSGTKSNGQEGGDVKGNESTSLSQGLGDFTTIFNYLGTPTKLQTPDFELQTPTIDDAINLANITISEYLSDGATYSKASAHNTKSVKFNEQTSNEEQVTTDAVSDSSLPPDTPTLTKKQRKKKNAKERKAREAALAEERLTRKVNTSISESEAEIVKKTPARKASAHVNTSTPQNRYNLRQRNESGRAITAIPDEDFDNAVSNAVQKVQSAKIASPVGTSTTNLSLDGNQAINQAIDPSTLNESLSHFTNKLGQHSASAKTSSGSNKLFPASVQPPANSAAKRSSTQHQASSAYFSDTTNNRFAITPMVVRSNEDRHWALLMKLIRDFSEDRRHLVAPMNMTTHNNDPNGIHVFVDASNIFIGFADQLKLARGIHPLQKIPAVGLSFDALALLIERRRSVAKRVLVGSTPHLPAFDKAKAVGYECNILEKVYKARELTERRLYFKELDRMRNNRTGAPRANNVATLNGGRNGSGSETNAPQYDPPRMIEQGVDEILHLKILESIVDADKPGTIVLATGDAAQAEYSDGFMRMAERALTKGWTVELVSWSKNISQLYTKRAWTEAWGSRFRIIYLDDYAEELLDM